MLRSLYPLCSLAKQFSNCALIKLPTYPLIQMYTNVDTDIYKCSKLMGI